MIFRRGSAHPGPRPGRRGLGGPLLAAALLLPPAAAGLAAEARTEPVPAPAAPGGPPAADPDEHRRRRVALVERLREHLGEGERGVFLWRAGEAGRNEERFRPDTNFFYLTGHDEPDAVLLIVFTGSTLEETLFLPEREPSRELWTGPRLGPGGLDEAGKPDTERRRAAERTGFASLAPLGSLNARLDSRAALGRAAVLFAPHESGGLERLPTKSQIFLDLVRSRFPSVRLADPAGEISRLRLVKSAAEIALIERAVAVTCEAHLDALRSVREARAEYEIQAVIESRFLKGGALGPAFPSIVAAGSNGTILHYTANRGAIRPGDLVVIDIGAEFGRYAADITRTLPASGRFTPRQKEIYGLVLKAQREAAALLGPGQTIEKIHARAREVLKEAGYENHFPHGTSHFLGLDVHDPGDRTWPFEPGAVLTVEPGIYLPEEGFGVRIEDDFLITKEGARRLSGCVPAEIEEIERLAGGR